MAEVSAVFRRVGSMGWLALAGSPPGLNQAGAQISERLLEVADLSRPPLLLTPEESIPSNLRLFLDDLQILLGLEVQVIHPNDLDDEELREIWVKAGILILAGGQQDFWWEMIQERLFRTSPLEILAEGAVLFAFGVPASLMGAWMLDDELHELGKGLSWILAGIVLPSNTDPAEVAAIHNHLEELEGTFALGLPDEALIALGPENQVEVWTEKAPVILLGRGWQH